MLVFYGIKCTPITNSWNTFRNVEKLKTCGNWGTKGVDITNISEFVRRGGHFKKTGSYHVFRQKIARGISVQSFQLASKPSDARVSDCKPELIDICRIPSPNTW